MNSSDDRDTIRTYPESLVPLVDPYYFLRSGVEKNARTILDDVLKEVKAAPNRGKLDIRGSMGSGDAIMKYNFLTFADEAVFVLENLSAPFIVLAVKELLLDIRNPDFKAYISRPVGALEQQVIESVHGQNGSNGTRGENGAGEVNRDGLPGKDGSRGNNGTNGSQPILPPVFFFVQKLIFGTGATPSRQFLNLNFAGIRGGTGGLGGNGGAGGDGHDGKQGATDFFGNCTSQSGQGGYGGGGGAGGRGGNAGNGGDGGKLFLFAPSEDFFLFSTATIEGAEPGSAGMGGHSGQGGRGGKGGAINPPSCNQGRRGADGGIYPALGNGSPGTRGVRGDQIVTARDNSDLF